MNRVPSAGSTEVDGMSADETFIVSDFNKVVHPLLNWRTVLDGDVRVLPAYRDIQAIDRRWWCESPNRARCRVIGERIDAVNDLLN